MGNRLISMNSIQVVIFLGYTYVPICTKTVSNIHFRKFPIITSVPNLNKSRSFPINYRKVFRREEKMVVRAGSQKGRTRFDFSHPITAIIDLIHNKSALAIPRERELDTTQMGFYF